jgi:succinylarginine dihydrolase
MSAHEVNFDGLVGPTHNYAGLSHGNVASTKNKLSVSSPRQAALQGIAKMKFLASLGLKQAVLPPHERPHVPTLRKLGFTGSAAQILERVARDDPALLASVCSSSHMWAANAATVSPSADTADRRVHFTPANLITQFHRSIEPPTTTAILRAIFNDARHFVVHDPLPAAAHFSDEGAANHTRLCRAYDEPGLEIFVYGRRAFDPAAPAPAKFPARQTYEACAAIARRHLLDPKRVLFVQQNPAAIDAGAFHNDVVAVGNQNVMLFHEHAFADQAFSRRLAERWTHLFDDKLRLFRASATDVSLEEAVESYLFNSQLLMLANGNASIVAPVECRDNSRARAFLEQLDQPFDYLRFGAEVHYVDVRQSMQNGGGPACLRLRVVLTDEQLARVHPGVIFDERLDRELVQWVESHYRDRLEVNDLRDPKLLDDSRAALDRLTQILGLGSIYEFQS